MEQRVSLITLGVRDLGRAKRFYESLGWQCEPAQEGIVVFDLIGQALGLYPVEHLARDLGVDPDTLGAGLATYAHNVRTREEVAPLLTRAEAAGGRVIKPAHDVFWGGHIGYFSDPDGHVWEVAHNPFSALRPEDGAFRWGGY